MSADLCAFLFACAVFVGAFAAGLLGEWWDRRQFAATLRAPWAGREPGDLGGKGARR